MGEPAASFLAVARVSRGRSGGCREGAVAPGVGGSPEPPQENDAGVGYVF
jgi:hypothetical protein